MVDYLVQDVIEMRYLYHNSVPRFLRHDVFKYLVKFGKLSFCFDSMARNSDVMTPDVCEFHITSHLLRWASGRGATTVYPMCLTWAPNIAASELTG